MDNLSAKIIDLLDANGPMTGGEIASKLGDVKKILVWKTCMDTDRFHIFNCARYYLRYDITRDDQIRLSPSVLRDFLSFTLIYLPCLLYTSDAADD